MKRQVLICLSFIVLFVGTQASQLHSNHHTPDLHQKPELLQTHATTEAEVTATATAATGTGTETDCEPECLYKFPYIEGECEEKPPGPEPEKPETFIEEFSGCYTFNLTVEEEFVEDDRGCYTFTSGGPPIIIPPEESSDESCDEKTTSSIYRYPFVHPGEDCPVITGEEHEDIFYDTTGSYEGVIPIEEYVTVAEDGETTIYTTYAGEEIISFENGTTIIINEDHENFETYEESGEEIVLIPPTEEITEAEGGETSFPGLEHGEEFVIIYETCYEYTENEAGEVITVNEEFGFTTEEIPPEVIVQVNEDGEMIILTNTEGSYSEELPGGEPSFEIETGEGTSETYDTSGEVIFPLEGEPVIIETEGGEVGETYDTSGEVIFPIVGEPIVIETEGGEVGETYETSGEWSIPFEEVIIITEEQDSGFNYPPIEPPLQEEECIILTDTYSTGTTIIYGQPTTYITYNTYNTYNHHQVSYTYVLTNIYSGIFKTSEYQFVIYGAGAVNFYNNYYGIDARIHDTPSCSCTCGYQTYTFTYSFGF